MRITIEDLEALRELNDELEENHMETEKQLNEDLGKTFCPMLYCSAPYRHNQSRRKPTYANKPRRLTF